MAAVCFGHAIFWSNCVQLALQNSAELKKMPHPLDRGPAQDSSGSRPSLRFAPQGAPRPTFGMDAESKPSDPNRVR
jgi:hypothetical protein